MTEPPPATPTILILTPVKQAAGHLDRYFELLDTLSYPADRISLGMLEGDSTDATYESIARTSWHAATALPTGDPGPLERGLPASRRGRRWAPPFQLPRRVVLARARNRLLHAALHDEQWVLWLDVDVVDYPHDVIEQLLAAGKEIVTPHCVTAPGGPSFDWNAWRDNGQVRLDQLRGEQLVRLDAVGGTMLLSALICTARGSCSQPFCTAGAARSRATRARMTLGRRRGRDRGPCADGQGHGLRVLGDAPARDRPSQCLTGARCC